MAKRKNKRNVHLEEETIRAIVRMEMKKTLFSARSQDTEIVLTQLRRGMEMPENILPKPQPKREAPKFMPDSPEEERNDIEDAVDNRTKHIQEGENPLLDKSVIYQMKADIVRNVIDEIEHELIMSITRHLSLERKRYQEAGSKDGISSIILLPIPRNRE